MKITNTKICHNTKKPKPIFSIDVSKTNIITSSLDGEIRIWNKEYEQVKVVKKHTGAVLCVRFNANGHLFASGGDDGAVIVYKINGDVVVSVSEHESDVSNIMWTNKFLVSVGYDGHVVFYDLESFAVVRKIKPHDGQIKGVSADKTFRYMCTQGEDGIVLYEDFEVIKRIKASEGIILESFFSRMSWSPDSRFFASGLSFNTKYNTVEIFNRDLKDEYSLIGHVAPCEVAMFSPNVYGRDKRYYVLSVSSQDLSLSFWCSLSPRPFLLIKNLTELPVLDMRWSEDGASLFVCSYGGEVMRIDIESGDFGEVFKEEIEDARDEIFFSMENMEIFKRMEEKKTQMAEDEGGKDKKIKKVIKPVLISENVDEKIDSSGVEINTGHSYLAILNHKRQGMVDKVRTSSLSRRFGDFNIELNEDRTCVFVRRGAQEFYQVHGKIDIVCVNKRYICLYTGKIQLYHLRTGVLAVPFICADDVASMDILGRRLLYLHTDGTFTVFSLDVCKVFVQGRLPRCDGLLSLRLSRRYFMIAVFSNEEYFFGRKSGVWFLKTPKYNSILAKDTDLLLDYDDTLSNLENELLIMYIAKDRRNLVRTARRIARVVSGMRKTTDFIESKLSSIFQILLDVGEKSNVVEMLERINTNHLFQPFVFSTFKKIEKI